MDLFSCDGVVESQKLGVQKVSSIAGQAGVILKWLAGCAVQGIANQGMADRRQMDSDLMSAAGMQAHLKCRGVWGARDHRCR